MFTVQVYSVSTSSVGYDILTLPQVLSQKKKKEK